MKTYARLRFVFLAVPVLLLFFAASPCFAAASLAVVTKEVAKDIGLEVRTNPAGVDAIRFELEFETKGALQDFERVDLEISEGGKMVSFSSLREEKSKDGHIVVSFVADRARLNDFAARVVVGRGLRVAYQVQLKDFVAAETGH